LLTYLQPGMLIADLNENKPLYGTGERPRGPGLSIHYEYIVGYLHNLAHKGLGSPANVVHGLPLCVLERYGLAGSS
jgi:hypothetical protein